MATSKTQVSSASQIGKRVREIRESRGLTRKTLAQRAGITAQAITQVETGKRKPAFDTLVALAEGLAISLDALVGRTGSGHQHDLLNNADALGIAEKTARMTPELQAEVKDFVDFLWEKKVRKKAR